MTEEQCTSMAGPTDDNGSVDRAKDEDSWPELAAIALEPPADDPPTVPDDSQLLLQASSSACLRVTTVRCLASQ